MLCTRAAKKNKLVFGGTRHTFRQFSNFMTASYCKHRARYVVLWTYRWEIPDKNGDPPVQGRGRGRARSNATRAREGRSAAATSTTPLSAKSYSASECANVYQTQLEKTHATRPQHLLSRCTMHGVMLMPSVICLVDEGDEAREGH